MRSNWFVLLVVPTLLLVLISGCSSPTIAYIVRHTDRDGKADALTEAGEKRAQKLVQVISGEYEKGNLSAIFTTPTVRTWETIRPLSEHTGIDTTQYRDPDKLAKIIRKKYKGKRVAIAGHSNTVAKIIESLGADPPVQDLPHYQYDDLFVVVVSGKGKASVICLKYGERTASGED